MNEIELFGKAVAFAAEKHGTQIRKDGTSYLYHPMGVASLVKDAGYGIPYQIVAILHDVLEDTNATEEEVYFFGTDILEAVKLLTRPDGANEEEYVRAILTNPLASVVKNADKIHNLWDMPFIGNVGEKRSEKAVVFGKRYIEKAEMYYKGRFSAALDDTIEKVKRFLESECVGDREYPCYTESEMGIYKFDNTYAQKFIRISA